MSRAAACNGGLHTQGSWREMTTPNLKDCNQKQLISYLSAISTLSKESLLYSVLWSKKKKKSFMEAE